MWCIRNLFLALYKCNHLSMHFSHIFPVRREKLKHFKAQELNNNMEINVRNSINKNQMNQTRPIVSVCAKYLSI